MGAATTSQARFCHVCGAELVSDRRLCVRCNTEVFADHAAATPPRGMPVDALAAGVRVVDRYEIEEVASVSRLHVSYQARDRTLERTVVLRTLRDRKQPSRSAELRRQARLGSALRHPHILATYDLVEDERLDLVAIVEEHVGRRTLRDWLRARQQVDLPFVVYRALMLPMVSALAYAHRFGVIHRNLKPRKVLLDRFEQPRVSDFGLGSYAPPANDKLPAIVGTLEYLAPELADRPNEAQASGDIYALGAIFYEMVCGELPIRGDNDLDFLSKLLHTPPVPLVERAPDVIPGLDAVIMRCLAKAPDPRYRTADELLQALNDVLGAAAGTR